MTRIPDDMPIPAAGALALAGTTASDCVSTIAPLPRHTVLVSGATGGVGALATQLITARGATVIPTARPGAEEEFVRAMGATAVVDYTGDIAASVGAIAPGGVDSVIHLAGDSSALGDLVKRNGSFASTRGISSVGRSGVAVTAISATPARDTLDQLAEAVTESSLAGADHAYVLARRGTQGTGGLRGWLARQARYQRWGLKNWDDSRRHR